MKIWDMATLSERASVAIRASGEYVISPDGYWIVGATRDGFLRVWEAATGEEYAALAVGGQLTHVSLHPRRPLAACGDNVGNVYFAELVGIEYGPIIVTALDFGKGPVVRCSECSEYLPLEDGWLGENIACPRPGCDGRMRVNPFVITMASANHLRKG